MKNISIRAILVILLGLAAAAVIAYGVSSVPLPEPFAKDMKTEEVPVWLFTISGFLVLPLPYLFTRFHLMKILFVRRFAPVFAILFILAFVIAVLSILIPLGDGAPLTPTIVLSGVIAPVIVVAAAFYTRRLARAAPATPQ